MKQVAKAVVLVFLCAASASILQAGQESPAALPSSQYRALLDHYCVTCHNEKLKTAALMLDKADVGKVPEDTALWEKVVVKLRARAMPPAGMPRPDAATYDSFASYLESALDLSAEANPNPGRPAIHRLNRAEYANAIRDLLAIRIDASSLLPADDSGYGFDNIADVLSVSPVLLERYLSAARNITRLAIGDPTIRPGAETYNVSRYLVQNERMSDDLPFGSRGGVAIGHYFPLDAEYVVRISLARRKEQIIGLGREQRMDVRLDDERIKLLTIPAVSRDTGCEVCLEEQRASDSRAEDGLEVRFQAKAGQRLVQVAFMKETLKPEGVLPRGNAVQPEGVGVGSVTIEGPYNIKGSGDTPSRGQIFICHPVGKDDQSCARKILSALARRAYRRPVTDQDIEDLLALYKVGRSQGGFEAGIGRSLEGMLTSPDFLFRIEHDPANVAPGAAYLLSDLDLASRLSFFLWSSIPDDELLTLAERGKLKEPGVLDQEIRRMLKDPRSNALVDNFAGQWLYLRNLRLVSPDASTFPEFDDNLRDAFEQETKLFLESMLREDRSVLNLLDADYTFLNDRLARHYQIPNVFGSDFRRVTLTDENRRGLLGQGSILTVTSYATRTAPTLRGKWLLDNILGTPPPPPPPNVPSLTEGKDVKSMTMRQRMEQHRANPVCASCHARMDPLGFALENFDAIGKWRTTEGNTPIDASGTMPDGTKFKGPAELRKALLGNPDQFVATLTDKLLTYALGRGTEYYDAPAVRKITHEAAAANYRWSAIISGIVKSTPFQMRLAQPAPSSSLSTRGSEP